MQIEYNGEHSLTFYDYRNANMDVTPPDIPVYNTWSTWHLIPVTPPYVNPYTPRLNLVEIPGTNGVIDLSESLSGSVHAERRTGDWEFILDSERDGRSPWEWYHDIRGDIHGKWVVVVSADIPLNDSDKYRIYTGRITVTDFSVDSQYAKIKLSYNLGSVNTAWLSTGKKVGAQDVAWFIRENISDDWTPETFDDDGNGMVEDTYDHVISEDQFQIEWITPKGEMYEIEVDDDGTLIEEDSVIVTIPDEVEIVFEDEPSYDEHAKYEISFLNDDGSSLYTTSYILVGTSVLPLSIYEGETPISVYEPSAEFIGWRIKDNDDLLENDEDITVYSNILIEATYNYSEVYFSVSYYNDDVTFLTSESVKYGEDAKKYKLINPKSYYTANGKTSKFVGWSANYLNITNDRRLYAIYEYPTNNYHTVTYSIPNWLIAARGSNYTYDSFGGQVIYTDIVPHGGKTFNKNPKVVSDSLFEDVAVLRNWEAYLADEDIDVNNVIRSFELYAMFDYSLVHLYTTLYKDDHSMLKSDWVFLGDIMDVTGDTDLRNLYSDIWENVIIERLSVNMSDYGGNGDKVYVQIIGEKRAKVSLQTAFYVPKSETFSSINGNEMKLASFVRSTVNFLPYTVEEVKEGRRYTGVYTYNYGRYIDEPWSDIITSITNDTYSSLYKIGDIKEIDISIDRNTYHVNMEIVEINTGINGNPHITWMAMEGIPYYGSRDWETGIYDDFEQPVASFHTSYSLREYLDDIYQDSFPIILQNAIVPTNINYKYINPNDGLVHTEYENRNIWIPSYNMVEGYSRFSTSNLRKKYMEDSPLRLNGSRQCEYWLLSDRTASSIKKYYAYSPTGERTTIDLKNDNLNDMLIIGFSI